MGQRIRLKDIQTYFNSPRFARILSKISGVKDNLLSSAEELISIGIEYVELFGESGNATIEEMEEILKLVVKKKNKNEQYNLNDAFSNKILRDLELKGKELSEQEMEVAKKKAIEILGFRGKTNYYAFNKSFVDNEDVNKLRERFNMIFKKYNIKTTVFEEENNISSDLSKAYKNALLNPRWFAALCGEENFVSRDHKACYNHMVGILNKFNFSQNDQQFCLKMFEECYKSLVVLSQPRVSIETETIEHQEEHRNILQSKFSNLNYEQTLSVLKNIKSKK